MSSVNNQQKISVPRTFLNYKLTPQQDAIVNYFIPSVTSLLLYIFLFASEVALVFRHFTDDNPIWASLTLFVMFFPSLCAYIVTISSWELWPDAEGCERDNCMWFCVKTVEHICFPIWAMWRYAERIFWSIEALRSTDEKFIASAIETISAPRVIELYFFFQAFLHSLPQMLIQLNILMRQNYEIDKQTADAEILSFAFNLTKLAATITFYQRFKSQKLTGKQYPWFKAYKQSKIVGLNQTNELRNEAAETEPVSPTIEDPVISESRRSSDFYLEPEMREIPITLRETSVLDGPRRTVFNEYSEADIIKRIRYEKGLPEDDLAGKLVSFFWWSCFLLVRILAISTFFYFYPQSTVWILFAHFVIVECILIYDVKTDDVKRGKILFFAFIGLIYIFCIIEFKIRFKKVKFLYGGFFSLIFLQNFIMCIIWWNHNVEDLRSDFWFRYIFYIIIYGSIVSVSSMLLYINIFKPKKIIVNQTIVD